MNLAVLAERHVERYGEYTTLYFEGNSFSNAQLLRDASRFATALEDLGVKRGDRVGVMLPNIPEINVCYGGITRAGAVNMPMVFLLAPPEIRHILDDAGATVMITSPEFYGNVALAMAGMNNPPKVILVGDPAPEGTLSFGTLMKEASPGPIVDVADDELAVIMYTSGTTGRPKGVMLTHGNMLFNAENTGKVATLEDGDIGIACLPMAHLFGLGTTLIGSMYKASGVMLRWFTAEGFFDAVNTYKANTSAMVPTMLAYMLAHPDFDKVDWSSMRYIVVAAAPVPMELVAEFEKRTGARVLEGYGLTETSPSVSLMTMADPPHPGSCGRPMPNMEVAVFDDDGNPVPANQTGEVVVKGPNIMKGYYNLPDLTAEAIRNGWFHTGDIGHLDEDGYLYITERKKDLIIRGGFNIFPRDVEEVLYAHPSVQECAVVGVPDPTMGEEVVAYVVLRPGAKPAAEELISFAQERLAKFKTPRHVVFADSLPKNPIGKIMKKDLRARASGELA